MPGYVGVGEHAMIEEVCEYDSEGLKELSFNDLIMLANIMQDRPGEQARGLRLAIRQEVYRRDYNV